MMTVEVQTQSIDYHSALALGESIRDFPNLIEMTLALGRECSLQRTLSIKGDKLDLALETDEPTSFLSQVNPVILKKVKYYFHNYHELTEYHGIK